jgi:hypothetical protein
MLPRRSAFLSPTFRRAIQNGACMMNKNPTGFRKANAASEAVKEPGAEIFLEFQDLV